MVFLSFLSVFVFLALLLGGKVSAHSGCRNGTVCTHTQTHYMPSSGEKRRTKHIVTVPTAFHMVPPPPPVIHASLNSVESTVVSADVIQPCILVVV